MTTELNAIAFKVQTHPKHRFQNLFGTLKPDALYRAWANLNKQSSAGIDGVESSQYEADLSVNINTLAQKLQSSRYRVCDVKRVYIPKGNGKKRPLGLPTLEDKIVQQSVAETLQAIWEQDFLCNSYGYRPNRSAHQAPGSKIKCTTLSYNLAFSWKTEVVGIMNYSHLDWRERTLIKDWYKQGISLREIGRRLNRSHTTISRELRRNLWCGKHYYIRGAQEIYERRLKRRAQRYRLKTEFIRNFVTGKLQCGWTPELISGRLREFYPGNYICHESIYQYIYIEAPELIELLARKHKKRRAKYPYRKSGERLTNRTSIEQRPIDVETRNTVGHWESDSVVGADRSAGLNVIVERSTRLVNITLIKNKTAKETKKVLIRRLSKHPGELVKSITYDNGTENVLHEEVNINLDSLSFFCAPYHSWEKGSVEQVNGLIRRIFPKGTDFNSVTHAEINRVEKLLNNRPRKCLNYQTPYEVFRKACGALAG